MKTKISIIVFALFLMLSFGSVEQILACSCIWESPCQKYERAEIVFAGKVVEINYKEKNLYGVVFEISDAFKGLNEEKRFEILSSQNGGGDCSYEYKLNEELLIYTSKNNDGNYSPSICSIETLKYENQSSRIFKSLRNRNNELIIFGKIRDVSDKYKRLETLENIKIKAQGIGGNKNVFFGTANENGFYEMKVPIGRYLISPILPKNFLFGERNSETNRIIRVGKQTCNSKYFLIKNQEK